MNVSSVKNLNGEVFSAVQDASLTNVVQTNSGNWQDITAYQSNSASYLTAHQDLSNYYTTADANTLSSMFSAAIDYVSANAGDEFPISADEAIQYVQTNSAQIDETVTSFQTNSSTYMIEPNLEYNAVNEISGYNGSAIAQYGAEKQWLVHDDTLVHAANSAQYALGVNVSAVAQLLGVDETVLWENSTSAYTKDITWPQSLNENITGFTKVKFLYAGDDSYKPKYSEFDATEGEYELTDFFQQPTNTGYMFIRFGRFKLSGTNFTNTNNMTINCVNNQNWQDLSNIGWNKVYKVIGIGRKQ